MRRAGNSLVALFLAGCVGVTGEVAPGGRIGPTLVLDVANQSDRAREVGYEFEYPNGEGSGGGTFAPCERHSSLWGEISGTYSILVDGEPLVEAQVPPEMPADGHLVITVTIDRDGEAQQTAPPRWARVAGDVQRPLPGCG